MIKNEIIEEIKDFIKAMKKQTDVGMDKHMYDHILWLVEDYEKTKKTIKEIAKLDDSLKKMIQDLEDVSD